VIRAALAAAALLAAAPVSTLRLAEMTPPTLDPALASSPDAVMLQNAICDRLYTTSPSGTVVPQIAKALPLAGPNSQRPKQWTTYTIRLKSTYRFADGSPVTAYSFADAFARDADPDMASPVLPHLKEIVGVAAVAESEASTVSGVRAVTDTTLQIATMRPDPTLAGLLAQPYLCPVEEDTPVAPGGSGLPPSAGPYYVKNNVPGEIVLARNPYYGGTRKGRFAQIELASGVGFDSCRARARARTVDVCLDALPQHAANANLPQLVAEGWISKSLSCLAWQPLIRLDLTALCRS
jgi:oligopeptide transport system substrate-binding protein